MTGRAHPLVALRFQDGVLRAIDQRALPWQETELELRGAADVAAAIRGLAIRGAPLIGVAAAYGIALEMARDATPENLARACQILEDARPTAVNLGWAVRRVRDAVTAGQGPPATTALAEAGAIRAQEEEASQAIARHGADLLDQVDVALTHCNTGALAAPGAGTALAVIAELFQRGRLGYVVVTETRPLLQGARLTAYELSRMGIPYELVVDGAAPGLIASGTVGAVVVGCDRVAANGDVANKVGTYGLALAAQAAGVPFVVAGPTSTIDSACRSGSDIVIEERGPDEVLRAGDASTALPDTPCRNPAFDVTPAELVTALVTEQGVVRGPPGAAHQMP
ncbi:MAG: S-methyl-5-thioribose-1-phosphate isomerase [Solirubrobacteraceae bacterium]